MSLPIFWEIPGQPSSDFDVKSPENLHLLRRIVGVAFSRLARREDWTELFRLVTHQYWTIRAAAAEAIARLANIEDLDTLVEQALTIPYDERRELIRALCYLDRKYFGDMSERTPMRQKVLPYSLLE